MNIWESIKEFVPEGATLCMSCMELYDSAYDVCPYCGNTENHKPKELLHLEPGTLLKKRYIVGNSIGYGGFGITYIGWDTMLKRKVAIKEYMPSEFSTRKLHEPEVLVANSAKKQKQYHDGMKKFLREAQNLAQVGDIDGIVYIYESFEANHTAYIVMEYLEGETLAAWLEKKEKVSEAEAFGLLLPLLKSLDMVHEKGIIHRDIAPDNIFLVKDAEDNIHVKLIDFGASRFATTSHSKSLTVLIKPGYSPEEQYRSDGGQGTYTDVYALAAVLYRMVTGVVPPDAFERRTAIESGKKDILVDPSVYNAELSENFEIAVLNALNVRVEDRTATVNEFVSEVISFEPVERRGSRIKKIDFMKWPLWAKIMVPTAGIVSLSLVCLLMVGVIKYASNLIIGNELPEGMVRVPDIVNESVEIATEQLISHQLVFSNVGGEYSPNVPVDIVLEQGIAGGSIVTSNSIINVVVSTEEESYLMPDVTGMSEVNAKRSLECLGMEIKTIEAENAGLYTGCVISQDIEPYTEIKSGNVVTLTISGSIANKGGKVPALTGLTYQEALEKAAEAGVLVEVSKKEFTDKYADGEVIAQSVSKGAKVKEGEAVKITVALKTREFSMPNLMYKTQATAVQILKNMGMDVKINEEISELIASGLVSAQNVKSKQNVKSGESMVLTVSKGTKPFDMPNVSKLTLEEAQKKLQELGLSVLVEYDYDEKVKEGKVISQSVKKGTDVTRGTEIKLVVCSTQDLIKVQDVTGMSREDAKKILKNQGFKVVEEEAYNSRIKKGNIISQLPKAGSLQKAGVTVALTASKGEKAEVATEKKSQSSVSNESKKSGSNSGEKTSSSSSAKWSEWVTELPAGVTENGYEIDTKTQYRSRKRETTTSSESTMSGWTLYDSKWEWGDYGSWSSWSTTAVTESDSRKVQSETRYSYRDKSTQTSSSSSLSGWTRDDSKTTWVWGSYGSWSDWQDTAITDTGDDMEVQTRQVLVSDAVTTYTYGAYFPSGASVSSNYTHFCPTCGNLLYGGTWTFKAITQNYRATVSSLGQSCGHKGTFAEQFRAKDNILYYYETVETTPAEYKTQYRKRTRSKVYTYSFYKWSDWSSYSTTQYTETSTREVRTQKYYRYCDRDKIYTYYFEKWGDWSSYSDSKPTASADVEVKSRILYRYRKK